MDWNRVKTQIKKTAAGDFLGRCYGKCKEIYTEILRIYVSRTTKINPKKIAIMTNTDMYTCNPKYIYEELVRRNKGYDITWFVNKRKVKREGYPEDAKVLSIFSRKGLREIFSSRIWLDNGIAFSDHFDKKEGQLHIQTMHGSLGIKRLDNAVLCRNERGWKGRRVVRRESNDTDFVIVNSQFEEDVFRTVFWKNTPMVRLGHARTDILFETDPERIGAIRKDLFERYQIPADKKLVLYGPTHRKGLTAEDLNIDYNKLTKALSERFGGEYVVMIRMHQRTKNIMFNNNEMDEAVSGLLFDVTDYPDIQELMLVTDVGITDYSSWIYDYVNTRRTGFIFASDLERYNNNTGFYYPLEETPFPVCKTSDELVEQVLCFDEDSFLERTEAFLKDKEAVDDGMSAKRIVDWMETFLNEK